MIVDLPPHVGTLDASARAKVEAAMTSHPCGLLVCDALEDDFPILYVNRQFETATGYAASEIVGKNCRFLQFRGPHALERHPLVDGKLVAKMRDDITHGRDFQGTVLNFTRDGTPVMNDLLMCPIFGDTTRPTRVTHYAGIQRFHPAPQHIVDAISRETAAAEATPATNASAAQAQAQAAAAAAAAAAAERPPQSQYQQPQPSTSGGRDSSSSEPEAKRARIGGTGDDDGAGTTTTAARDATAPASNTQQQQRGTVTFARFTGGGSPTTAPLLQMGDEVLALIAAKCDLPSLACLSATCKKMRSITYNNGNLWYTAALETWGATETTLAMMDSLLHLAKVAGWRTAIRDVCALDKCRWRTLQVRGSVTPHRTNCTACSVGSRIVVFGGEGSGSQAFSDTHVLDLSSSMSWQDGGSRPDAPPAIRQPPPPLDRGEATDGTPPELRSPGSHRATGAGAGAAVVAAAAVEPPPPPRQQSEAAAAAGAAAAPPPPAAPGAAPSSAAAATAAAANAAHAHAPPPNPLSAPAVQSGDSDSESGEQQRLLLQHKQQCSQQQRGQGQVEARWKPVETDCHPPGRWGHTLTWLSETKVLLFGGCDATTVMNDLWVLTLDVEVDSSGNEVFPDSSSDDKTSSGNATTNNAISLAPEAVKLMRRRQRERREHMARLPPHRRISTWRRVQTIGTPEPRSWHSCCVVNNRELVISGGCSASGRLMNDLHIIDLSAVLDDDYSTVACWHEVNSSIKHTPRLGHSLVCVTTTSSSSSKLLFLFGGLATVGNVRIRSSDAYLIDLSAEWPTWCEVAGPYPGPAVAVGTGAGAMVAAVPPPLIPPPRLEHVAASVLGGRILVFGGSLSGVGSSHDVFVFKPHATSRGEDDVAGNAGAGGAGSAGAGGVIGPIVAPPPGTLAADADADVVAQHISASWKHLRVHVSSPPKEAWGYSACNIGSRSVIVPYSEGGYSGLTELLELMLVRHPSEVGQGNGSGSGGMDSGSAQNQHAWTQMRWSRGSTNDPKKKEADVLPPKPTAAAAAAATLAAPPPLADVAMAPQHNAGGAGAGGGAGAVAAANAEVEARAVAAADAVARHNMGVGLHVPSTLDVAAPPPHPAEVRGGGGSSENQSVSKASESARMRQNATWLDREQGGSSDRTSTPPGSSGDDSVTSPV